MNKVSNIRNQEKNVLFLQKTQLEQKSAQLAMDEIQRDEEYIIDINKQIKQKELELKKILKQVEKEKLQAKKENEKFKKAFEKLKKVQEEPSKVKTNNNTAGTILLSRIIHYLETGEMATQTKLADYCCSTGACVKTALSFLVKNNLIIEQRIHGTTQYSKKRS